MAPSCRLSCALRMMGLATAPHSRSATMVAARCNSRLEGPFWRFSQTKMSGSAIFPMVAPILPRSLSSLRRGILGGILFSFSMFLTRFSDTPARPISRSAASGGQAHIRREGSMEGFSRSRFGPMSVRLPVAFSVASTSAVVCFRVVRKASGAKRMNQSLYMSTDRAMSSFHRSGLSLLTAITCPFLPRRHGLSAGKAPTSPGRGHSGAHPGQPPPS